MNRTISHGLHWLWATSLLLSLAGALGGLAGSGLALMAEPRANAQVHSLAQADAGGEDEGVGLAARAQTREDGADIPLTVWVAAVLIVLVILSAITNAIWGSPPDRLFGYLVNKRAGPRVDHLFLEIKFFTRPENASKSYFPQRETDVRTHVGFLRSLELHYAQLLTHSKIPRGTRVTLDMGHLPHFPNKEAILDATVHTCYPYGRNSNWYVLGLRFNAAENCTESDIRQFLRNLVHRHHPVEAS